MPKDEGGRIRLVVFDLEGSNETLQDSLRTIANVLQPRSAPQQRPANPTPPAIQGNGKHIEEQNDQTVLDVFAEDEEDDTLAKKKPKSNGNKPRVYPTPNILNNVDLEGGDMPFKEFWKQKNPTEHTKRYLVIAAWFKEYRNTNAITDDHLYTCYRYMNLNVQKDVLQPLRRMKDQGWFKSGQERGSFEITLVGLNVVNDMGKGS